MAGATFSIIYWNIWQPNQLQSTRFERLRQRFDTLIDTFQPDAFGLNEVVARTGSQPALLNYLESKGYHTTFAPFGPLNATHVTGSAFASRQRPANMQLYELGPDNAAKLRGHHEYTAKSIFATIPVGQGSALLVGVNHLVHLVPHNWKSHARQHRSLVTLLSDPVFHKTTIMGGDFNRPKFMVSRGDIAKNYHRATGSFLKPTWRIDGLPYAPLRASYDNIFWSKCGTVLLHDYKILPHDPSDHAPLFGSFYIAAK